MRGPLCRALVLLALARAAVATTPAPTPASTCADEWGPLVGVTSRNMSFPTAQYTNLFDSEVTARAQRRQRQHAHARARARPRRASRCESPRRARARVSPPSHAGPLRPLPARRQTDLEALQEWWVLDDLEYTMSMRVTSTCDSTIRFGFQGLGGAGGFMIFDVPAGADAQSAAAGHVGGFPAGADFHVGNGYASTISACVVACSDIRPFGLAECEPTPSPTATPRRSDGGVPTSSPTPSPTPSPTAAPERSDGGADPAVPTPSPTSRLAADGRAGRSDGGADPGADGRLDRATRGRSDGGADPGADALADGRAGRSDGDAHFVAAVRVHHQGGAAGGRRRVGE